MGILAKEKIIVKRPTRPIKPAPLHPGARSDAAGKAVNNRLHEVDQRLVRWLLMCQDRVDSELLPLTHEFLAQMLGTGRPSVSLAAADLENAGLIENMRGTIRVLNRKSLEEAACECYGVIQHFNGGVLRAKQTPKSL